MIDFDRVVDRSNHYARKWDLGTLAAHFGRSDVLPMWIADMDFLCPDSVVRAMKETAERGIYGYTFVPDAYYDAVARWCMERHGWKIEREWITLTHGTVGTLHYIVQEFCDPGDECIVQTPGYDPFERAIKSHGAKMVCNPLKLLNGRYELDFEDLSEKAKSAKLMIFCSPHNPTGRVWTKAEFSRVAEICISNQVLLVVDEIHKDLTLHGNRNTPVSDLPGNAASRCIVCVSPNKAFNFGGLKSSYTVIPDDTLRSRLRNRLRINSITSPNVFAAPALIAAYRENEWLDALIRYIEGNFAYVDAYLSKNFPQVKLVAPEATYLAWLDFRRLEKSDAQLKSWLINEAKLGLSFGDEFISGGEGFARMNLGCPRSIVEEAMRRLRG